MNPRINNWPDALAAFVEEKRNAPFVWGVNDCCLFTSDWILKVTLEDPAITLGLRGTYSTALEAARILERLGGAEALPGLAGYEEVPLKYAQRGDMVSLESPTGIVLGVCLGRQVISAGPLGAAFDTTLKGRKAWRVG